ncbi:hypothetical protein [Streptomyces sp. NPDC048111]|uniref:hypothetical protein n=1 Tax=Streptomyces sp. NPDC048111 TaxID=3365500 RepID=UPI00372241D8
MTPAPTARATHARRPLARRWFTAPLLALALLGTGAGTSSAAPADDADRPAYLQPGDEPAFTAPSARGDDLPPYDAHEAQQAVDAMVMDEEEEAEARHCPQSDAERQADYERWGPHRDEAYPVRGGDGDVVAAPQDEPEIVG